MLIASWVQEAMKFWSSFQLLRTPHLVRKRGGSGDESALEVENSGGDLLNVHVRSWSRVIYSPGESWNFYLVKCWSSKDLLNFQNETLEQLGFTEYPPWSSGVGTCFDMGEGGGGRGESKYLWSYCLRLQHCNVNFCMKYAWWCVPVKNTQHRKSWEYLEMSAIIWLLLKPIT